MNINLNRYFYSILLSETGEKEIRLFGCISYNNANETENKFLVEEWTFLYLSLEHMHEMLNKGTFFDFLFEKIGYMKEVSETEALKLCQEFFSGKPGEELPLQKITKDTPCGIYWFNQDLSEEQDSHTCDICDKPVRDGYTDDCTSVCENCFAVYMNKTYGENKWRRTKEIGKNGGYYEYEHNGQWIDSGFYFTEWEE